MKIFKPLLIVVALALVATGCSLFGSDGDGTSLSSAEGFESEPAANVVEAAPVPTLPPAAEGAVELDEAGQPITDGAAGGSTASAALPTAVTIPEAPAATEVPLDRTQPTSYVVQSGDVLGLIAERFDVDIAELRRVNDLSGNLIQVGQTLTIPALSGATASTGDEVAGSNETAAPAPAATRAPVAAPAPVSCGASAVGYCVQSGDSLLGIASSNGVSVDALRAANPSLSGDLIRIGDLLTIPGQSSGTATTQTTTTTGTTGTTGTTASTTVEAVAAPTNNADCAARNFEFPFFHAANGRCYANPIGGTDDASTTTSTASNADDDSDVVCEEGRFLFTDGQCYPIPGFEAPTPTAAAVTTVSEDFGRPPCDAWEVVLENNRCWPDDTATAEQREAGKVGAPTATPTPTS